ncbi:MAG: aminotransferase class III-fold pyridoxal phosphate-dependent enzyme [Bacteroidia bacterium]|nr:aminotransferase class III-fold pyridoxal phosphate-dependent enzyme [Bacteroidia bacterium]
MLYEVYPKYDINFVQGDGCYVIDDQGQRYLDCYGGHAVISLGHNHPNYIAAVKDQIEQLGFYSNSVNMPLQEQLAERVNQVAGIKDYQLFMCNSGAEANENALKLASHYTERKKILAFGKGFHGRMTACCSATDNPKIHTELNRQIDTKLVALNDKHATEEELKTKEYAAVIIEPIQGIGGMREAEDSFLRDLQSYCKASGTFLIMDEVQSGFGRSGDFFAYQHSGIRPDIITSAKGMGNGFPVGAVWVNPDHKPQKGILGSTFGGNQLACRAALAVVDTIDADHLLEHVRQLGLWLYRELETLDDVQKVTGRGLMLGIHFDFPIKALREHMLFEEKVFLGSSSDPNVIRFLPPLTIKKEQLQLAVEAMKRALNTVKIGIA